MVFSGYLDLGGRELVNGGRTSAYVATMLPNLNVAPCGDCDGLYEVLGHKVYTSPLVDQPGWFDVDNPDTWDFYGLYPLGFEGFEDATTTADVVEFIYDGGAISPVRRATRSMRVTGLLIGLTPQAVSAGMTWLRQVLRPGACGVSRMCSGEHMSYFVACPPLCEDSPDVIDPPPGSEVRDCATGAIVGPISACALPYERHLYNAVCVDGPRVVEEFSPACGAMVRVEFTIVAGVPSSFGTGAQIIDFLVDPSVLPTVPDRTCGDDDLSQVSSRMNYAPNPGPTLNTAIGWNASGGGAFFTGVFDTTMVHTPGGKSLKTTRVKPPDANTPHFIANIDKVGQFDENRPTVVAGLTTTVSVWMRTKLDSLGSMWLQTFDAAGHAIGTFVSGPTFIAANTWGRPAMTFDPPLGTASIKVVARMETVDGSDAPYGPGADAWFTEMLIEATPGPRPYFDGNTISIDPTLSYQWLGTPGQSMSRAILTLDPGPVLDPDCPPVPDPPRPPPIVESCVVPLETYKRFTVQIPATVVPRWSDLVPILSLTTGVEAVRQLRVRFYPNPAELPQYDLEQCSYIGEFIVSYIPPNSRMVINGISHDVTVYGPTGLLQTGSHLIYGSAGGPMEWPYMSCGSQYDLSVDVYPAVQGLGFSLCVAARE